MKGASRPKPFLKGCVHIERRYHSDCFIVKQAIENSARNLNKILYNLIPIQSSLNSIRAPHVHLMIVLILLFEFFTEPTFMSILHGHKLAKAFNFNPKNTLNSDANRCYYTFRFALSEDAP